MISLTIGTVVAVRTPEMSNVTPDDRQELIKCVEWVNGNFVPAVVVQDSGYVDEGEVLSYSGVIIKLSDFDTIKGYMTNRTMVQVITPEGTFSRRVRMTSWAFHRSLGVAQISVEFWKI